MAAMRDALTPGMSENELWSILNQVNAAGGGEWIETRLLAAGSRTNPWFHECGEAVIQAGDIVSFDTDMIGHHGYFADVSRTFLCRTDERIVGKASVRCVTTRWSPCNSKNITQSKKKKTHRIN